MFQNSIELGIKMKCIGQKHSQHQITEVDEASDAYVSQLINHLEKNANKTFLQ